MEEVKKTQVYNLVILDKSGSMHSIRKEAVNGFNETLGSIKSAQQKHQDSQEHFVSLAAFCSCGIDMIYDKTPINEAKMMDDNQYVPCCCTPLFDAIGKAVNVLRRDIKDIEDTAVLVTIITDGYENDSKDWSGPGVKALIEELKEEGWMFSFIGAGEDIVRCATTISITNTVVWEKTSRGTREVFANENRARDRYFEKMKSSGYNNVLSNVQRREMKKRFAQEFYNEEDENKQS
jgi:Mg-chelatase subunit ChlD